MQHCAYHLNIAKPIYIFVPRIPNTRTPYVCHLVQCIHVYIYLTDPFPRLTLLGWDVGLVTPKKWIILRITPLSFNSTCGINLPCAFNRVVAMARYVLGYMASLHDAADLVVLRA